MINYIGHGNMGRLGLHIEFQHRTDVNALDERDKLADSYFQVACNVVGRYNYQAVPVLRKAWLTKRAAAGAVSAVMSTISQPWDPPMRGQDYMNDLLTGGYDYSTLIPESGPIPITARLGSAPLCFNAL